MGKIVLCSLFCWFMFKTYCHCSFNVFMSSFLCCFNVVLDYCFIWLCFAK